jgi:hypothetical protein
MRTGDGFHREKVNIVKPGQTKLLQKSVSYAMVILVLSQNKVCSFKQMYRP